MWWAQMKIQVDVFKVAPGEFQIFAKEIVRGRAAQHLGGADYRGTGRGAVAYARRLAADLSEEFNTNDVEVVY